MPAITTLYHCPKGHEVDARFEIIVEDNGNTVDILPYAGSYCFVCFGAWIAANVPRTSPVLDIPEDGP